MLYNLLILLGGISVLPKWALQKKYKGSLCQRLGWKLPKKSHKKPIIWIHMVSMGETRAMIPIYQSLRKKYPNGAFYFSSTTATGQNEARKSLPEGEDYFFLPIDLIWIMKSLVKKIKPDLLILSEGDYWMNMIQSVKKRGGKVVVLNGKISEKSMNRFSKFPSFAKKVFHSIDHFCVQNHEYGSYFSKLSIPKEKLSITGNLKLSISSPSLTPLEKRNWQKKWGIEPEEPVLTIGSTHTKEEELLLPKLPKIKILLVPRHPERFLEVKKIIENYPNVTLVDEMGVLPICYQLSTLAIVGGSFISKIGGHNIFEPIQAGIPVIFGPYMDSQKEFVKIVLDAKAGIQASIHDLGDAINQAPSLQPNVLKLAQVHKKVAQKTWKELTPFLP